MRKMENIYFNSFKTLNYIYIHDNLIKMVNADKLYFKYKNLKIISVSGSNVFLISQETIANSVNANFIIDNKQIK